MKRVSAHRRHLIGQYVFKFPGGIPFVKDLEDFSTVDGEGKAMPWQPGGAIYPPRVDLHSWLLILQGAGESVSRFLVQTLRLFPRLFSTSVPSVRCRVAEPVSSALLQVGQAGEKKRWRP